MSLKINLKNVLAIILMNVLTLALFFILINLFYNQNRVLAQNSDQSLIQCVGAQRTCRKGENPPCYDTQIPIGESLDKSGELTSNLIQQLSIIDTEASKQIQETEDMVKGNTLKGLGGANQCDPSACQPQNCGTFDCGYNEAVPCASGTGTCYNHHYVPCCNPPKSCTSQWQWPKGQYLACPQTDIEQSYNAGEESFTKIDNAEKNIETLIDGQTELICTKENEDIRTVDEETTCASDLCKNNPGASGCPAITKAAAIKRDLDISRQALDTCAVAPTDWANAGTGPFKATVKCESVIYQGYQRQEPDCQCAPQASPLPTYCEGFNKKSFLNYYCCR